MLAYIFWHWKKGDTPYERYETALVRFHERFRAVGPKGFLGSVAVRTSGAPWANASGDVIEDWHVLEGSSALDVINNAAVYGESKAPHDEVARMVEGASAGLYLLRAQKDPARGTRVSKAALATWFSKPAGLTYEELLDAVARHASSSTWVLWGRYMGLGPTPEFLLLSDERPALPTSMKPLTLSRTVVWSGSSNL